MENIFTYVHIQANIGCIRSKSRRLHQHFDSGLLSGNQETILSESLQGSVIYKLPHICRIFLWVYNNEFLAHYPTASRLDIVTRDCTLR